LLPNSPITLILPIISGIIGTYVYFGLIHRTGLNLSGKEILVVGLLTTIIWTLVWTRFASIIWGYNNIAVIANIVMGFPTYIVGVFLCNVILKQIPRKPETHTTLLSQIFNQLRADEKILWNGKPAFISSIIPSAHWIISIPNTVAFIIVGLIGMYSLTRSGDFLGILFFIGSISYALIILSLVLTRIIRTMRKKTKYILTNQRLVIQTGNEKTESVELEKIRNIDIRNGPFDDILERVFKVSTIVVRTAEDSPKSLTFTYLKETNIVRKMFFEAIIDNVKGNQVTTSSEDLQMPKLPENEGKTEHNLQPSTLKRIVNAPIQFGYFLEDQAYKMLGGEELMKALSIRLREIGVNTELLDRRNFGHVIVVPNMYTLGFMKVNERNLDFIQVSECLPGSDESRSRTIVIVYNYVVQLDNYSVRRELEAYFGAVEKRRGFFSKEVENLGFQWEGGKLAEVLSKDSELNKRILDLKLARLEVRPEKVYLPSRGWPKIDKSHLFVRITPIPSLTLRALRNGPLKGVATVGSDDFPTREAFEVFDKIAWHVRSTSGSIAKKRGD
jgi:hypothetical protein